ncbi:MAG: FIST signal transduction protein [Candidatus Nanohalobium sp.]
MGTDVGVSTVSPENGSINDGKQLVKDAREDGGIEDEDFGILFTSTRFDFKSLVEGVDQEIGSEWIGGTTVAEISSEGSEDGSAVLMLVKSEEVSFASVSSTPVSEGAEDAAKKAVEGIEDEFDSDLNNMLFTLVPGFTIEKDGREFKFLKGLEKQLEKDIKITGGSTGDAHNLKENYQIKNGEIFKDNAVMAFIKTENVIETGMGHGFQDSVKTGVVTDADGRMVKEISGEPAAEFYADAIDVDVDELDQIYDTKLSEKLSVGLYYLYLKLMRKNPNMFDEILHYSLESSIAQQIQPGKYRIIAPLEVKKGGIKLMDKVQEGQTVDVLETDKQSVINAGREAFSDINPEDVLFGLIADCANRHMILDEDERDEEIRGVADQIGENMIGFYGEGEIGDGGLGMCTFMSQTLTGFVVKKE